MKDAFIRIVISQLLAFVASTIKNPKSVAKFCGPLLIAEEGLGTITTALNCATTTRQAGSSDTQDLLERIEAARKELRV